MERGGEDSLAQSAAGQKRIAYGPRLPTRGRRRAANTSARLRTTTLLARAFARYTATFRPTPAADGKTTLSIPSEIQMAANSCETEYPFPRKQSRTALPAPVESSRQDQGFDSSPQRGHRSSVDTLRHRSGFDRPKHVCGSLLHAARSPRRGSHRPL